MGRRWTFEFRGGLRRRCRYCARLRGAGREGRAEPKGTRGSGDRGARDCEGGVTDLGLFQGNCCHEPLDLYSYLCSQEIGTTLALLYITWAEALEARGNFRKADLIFQEGLQRRAEPLDKLQSHHRQFQARVSRQALLALEESPDGKDTGLLEIAEPQRSSLADLKGRGKKKVRAPISRVGDAVKVTNPNRSLMPQTSLQLSNTPGFAVFDENSASVDEIPTLTAQSWTAPPAPRAKENELSAGPWNSGKRPRSRSASNPGVAVPGPLPSFTPYVDESAQPQMMTPCKIEPSINHVLSARKPEKEDPLQRVQHHQQDTQEQREMVMYCKDKVYAGVDEFSLEEIRAEIYRKKAKKKTEEEMQAIAQKKEEIQRQIEELEKKLKEDDKQQQPREQAAEIREALAPLGPQGFTSSSGTEVGEKQLQGQRVNQSADRKLPVSGVLLLTEVIQWQRLITEFQLTLLFLAFIGDDVAQFLGSAEQHKKLLDPVPESLAASPDFYLEPGALPGMEVEKDIELGHETYCIKWEYWNNEEYKMFFAVPANLFQLDAKGFAIKVYSQPVPWDFYITLELQRRLKADFDQSFSESCSCHLYRDGCVVVHRDINRFTLGDVIRGRKSITEEVVFLVVYNLLGVVEKLHKAEIVHGDLRPEVFFLGDRICDAFANEDMASALKVVDFSHSLDLRLQSRVSSCNSFPISQTPHGQQLLAASSLPYQVDLVGIADIVHLMLFGDHIQVYQENSIWKISQNLPKTVDSDFWSKLFGRVLNAGGKSTAPLLRELREEIGDMFDSCFQERLCESLAALGVTFLL
ncbi:PREDICTED: mitotic checkpoint serine/threonine-protein kinase BUB1 beta [Lepidothrix coronata]|uniref:Mitotic checkpoint serine/threonine-protein kinase BUB1 beta n=1 Tax=Lepidothrix coronata TaxID=321398 RepID=A0A6J0J5G6_9PASS|nr:PREDICTED: mitotic checkpoint serine/threonine-protein kinase BUB1 beta [Lepidothrix coronata]